MMRDAVVNRNCVNSRMTQSVGLLPKKVGITLLQAKPGAVPLPPVLSEGGESFVYGPRLRIHSYCTIF